MIWHTDNVNVQDVLEKGLNDLMELCDVVVEKFEGAQMEFKAKNPAPIQASG
jgi:DNA-directed RNA polymerase I and III subunit RPAC2